MKIAPIRITNNIQLNKIKSTPAKHHKSITSYASMPAFYGRDLVKTNPLPEEIRSKMPEGYSIQDLIKLAQTEENKLGQGANSIVYSIPHLDDYALKVLNKDDPNKINMSEFPADVNLGQPVWQDDKNPRILILKKIEGKEHSIPNWSKTVNTPPLQITKEQASNFTKQLSVISNMPQETFDQFAKDVKVLSDKGYKLDSINPNNLLVDEKKQQIHIIDYFKVNPNETHLYQNSCFDLIAVACDFTLFPEYFDKMSDEEKQSTINSVKTITDKMYQGCVKSGLSCDDEKYITYINETSKWFPIPSIQNEKTGGEYVRAYNVRMIDFMDMVYNPEQWASKR
ncbi:MAG: serine/threonine protein kinase [Candidatus Gastranaerophilales bacterium]|nr:serine/threonine protein kinase [Candidatus Gastranaerophilales bacterium]